MAGDGENHIQLAHQLLVVAETLGVKSFHISFGGGEGVVTVNAQVSGDDVIQRQPRRAGYVKPFHHLHQLPALVEQGLRFGFILVG